MDDNIPDHNLLIRIDERTKNIEEEMKKFPAKYVSKEEFRPIKAFVYGLMTAVMLTVLGAVLTLVVNNGVPGA